jgi:chemotaxis methyl-accepting protein methylase
MTAWSQSFLPSLSDDQFAAWLQLVEERTGIDFSLHRSILQQGLNQRLRELDRADFDTYYDEVAQVPQGLGEWQMLLASLTVKETSFFRQPAAFEFLRGYLRKRAQRLEANTSLDLWSVGCSTGEEPYSLAITASEALAIGSGPVYFGVLATDICPSALAAGRAATYGKRRLDKLSDSLRRRYFTAVDGSGSEPLYQVNANLRARVAFSLGNLLQLDRMPALPMDVIVCQNVLVYFRRARVTQVLDALAARLKPGGVLVLGPGEAPHWHHPALVRAQHEGVTAWLRRPDAPATSSPGEAVPPAPPARTL